MSQTIDSKVVEMKFDNSNFEKNVKTSLKSLENLNKQVDNTTSSRGMEKLGAAADAVSQKFSALEAVAFGFLARLGSQAADAATKFVSELSIDNVSAGWDKYEKKTVAVQTIMAATEGTWEKTAESVGFTGTQMEFVADQLAKLNWYTDETSYNFTDMTDNIGKFTANNIELTDAVSAMQGIANWAALAGQDASVASRAMYNISQAVGLGKMTLLDWKSIENANMATADFKYNVIETALALGRLHINEEGLIEDVEQHAVSIENFRENLSDGWLDNEVLLTTLDRYGNFSVRLSEICDEYGVSATEFMHGMKDYEEGNRTNTEIAEDLGATVEDLIPLFDELAGVEYKIGRKAFQAAQQATTFSQAVEATKDAASTIWLNIFEQIFGNYEQAKVLWTDVVEWMYDVFVDPIDRIEDAFKEANKSGFRDAFIQGFYNLMSIISKVTDTIGEAFHEIFPINLVDTLLKFADGFKNITDKILNANEAWKVAGRIIKGFFASISIGITIFKTVFTVIKSVLKIFAPLGKAIVELFAALGDGLVKVDSTLKNSEKLKSVIEKITGALAIAAEYVANLFTRFPEFIQKVKNAITVAFNAIKTAVTAIKGWFTGLFGSKATEEADQFSNSMSKVADATESVASVGERLHNIFDRIKNVFAKIGEVVAPVFEKIKSAISTALGWIKENVSFDKISAIIASGLAVGSGVGLAIFTKKFQKSLEGIGKEIKSIVEIPKQLASSFTGVLQQLGGVLKAWGNDINADAIQKIAISVAILAAALIALSFVPWERLAVAVGTLTVLMGELVAAFKLLAGSDSANMERGLVGMQDALSFSSKATAFLKFAGAILILSGALAIIASIEPEKMESSMLALSVIIWEMVAVATVLSNNDKKLSLGIGAMGVFARGVKKCAEALVILSALSWDEVIRSLVTFSVMLGVIVGFSVSIEKTKSDLLKLGAGLIVFSIGMAALASAVKIMGSIPLEQLIAGIASLTILLGVITGMTIAISKTSGSASLIKMGAGLAIFSIGLAILSASLAIIGSLSIESLIKSLVSLSIILGIITGMTIAMSNGAGASSLVKIGAGLIVFSIGLLALIVPLSILMTLPVLGLIKAIAAFAAILGVLVGIGYAVKGCATALIKLGAAMILIGAGAILAGAGIILIAKGLILLGAGLAAVGAGIAAFVVLVSATIPAIVAMFGEMIKGIINVIIEIIGEMLPRLVDAGVMLFKAFLKGIVDSSGALFESIIDLLGVLVSFIPQIVEKLAEIIVTVINSLADHLPEIVVAIINFINKMFSAVGEALGNLNAMELATAILELATATLVLGVVGQMGPSILIGIGYMAAVIVALGALMVGIGALITYVPEIDDFLTKGIPVLEKIGYGLGAFFGNIIGGVLGGMSSAFPVIGENLSLFMTNLQPFLNGLRTVNPELGTAVESISTAILALSAASLLDAVSSLLGSDLVSFGEKMVPFADSIIEFSNKLSGATIDTEAVDSAANAGRMIAEFAKEVPNSGGLLGLLAGENDLDDFGDKIVPFADSIIAFSNKVKGADINVEAVEKAANAGKLLTALADTVPNSGGVLGFFAGDNDIDDFAQKIGPFAEAIVTFSNVVKDADLDSDAIEKAANAGRILAEMADTIPNSGGVAGFFAGNNDIDDFAEKIGPFGTAIKEFSDAVTKNGGINTAAVINSAVAGEALAGLYEKLPKLDGLWQKITGVPSMAKFKEEITGLGEAIVEYVNAVSKVETFDQGKIDASVSVATALGGLYDHLPNLDGLWSKISGVPNMAQFKEDITGLGGALVEYVNAVSGVETFDQGKIDASVSVATALGGLYDHLPKMSGLWEKITGVASMTTFAADLSALGEALVGYVDAVSGSKNMTSDAVDSSVGVATALGGLYDVIQNRDGFFTLFTGIKDTTGFAEGINSLGTAISRYADSVAGKDFSSAIASTDVIDSLTGIATSLPSDVSNFYSFGSNLDYFGECLVNFDSSIASISLSQLSLVVADMERLANMLSSLDASSNSSLKSFGDALKNLAKNGINDFISEFEGADQTASAAINTFIDGIVEILNSSGDSKFYPAGKSAIGRFSDAISESNAASKAGEIGRNAAVALNALYSDYYDAGVWNMEGYIQGMYSRSDSVYNMGYSLGQKAYEAAKKAVDSNSPSKKFVELGGNNGEGYAIGMRNSLGIVDKAATDMGDVSLEAMNSIISQIANMLEGDMDCSPTIRPVLDTSDIQNGIGNINGMFGNASIPIGTLSGRLSRNIGTNRVAYDPASGSTYNSPVYNVNVNVTAQPGMDEKALADYTVNRMNIEIRKQGAAWA